MPAILRDRLVVVWIILVAVTLVSSSIGGSGHAALLRDTAAVTTTVLVIAFVKVWLVMFTYMDVRGAPLLLRALCTVWLIVVLGALLAVYAGLGY